MPEKAACILAIDQGTTSTRAILFDAAGVPRATAQTEIDLRLQVRGVPRLSAPLHLRLEGGYVSGGQRRIPSFDSELRTYRLNPLYKPTFPI